MPELNEKSQVLIDIVTANKDYTNENDVLGELIGAGVPFNKAKGLLEKIMVDQGLRMSKAERDDKAEELMASFSITEETTAEDVSDQVDTLVDELNCTVGIARGYVKRAFTEADVPYPKATKATGGQRSSTPGFNGDAKLVSDYLIANKDCTREQFDAFMTEHGKDKTKNGIDKTGRWWNVLVDLKVFAESYCSAE